MKKILILVFLLLSAISYGQLAKVNVGSLANDHTGDKLRNAFVKVNLVIDTVNAHSIQIPLRLKIADTATMLTPYVNRNDYPFNYLDPTSSIQTQLNDAKTGVFNVKSYGALGDGSHDDTQAIKDALTAAGRYSVILFPAGEYKVTSKIKIDQDRVSIRGLGKHISEIIFQHTTKDTLFIFRKLDNSMIVQCEIKDLGISSQDTVQKTAIAVIDADIFNVENIAIYPWSSTNYKSVGILLKGRDQISIKGIDDHCDRPIIIAKNPNFPIDLDHAHFMDCYLSNGGGTSVYPLITVNSGIYLTNISFDGYQAWVGGTYGFYWNDTETYGISANISFTNVRYEEGLGSSWGFHISYNSYIKGLVFHNVLVSSNNGFYLRHVTGIGFSNVETYANSGSYTAIDMDATVSMVNFNNVQFESGSVITNSALGLSGGYNRFTPNGRYVWSDSYFIPNVTTLLINPAVQATVPFTQLQSPSVTVAAGDSIIIGSGNMIGMLFITEKSSAYLTGLVNVLYQSDDILINSSSKFSSIRDNSSTFNIYFNVKLDQHILQNKTAYSSIFYLTFIGVGDHQLY